MATVDIESLSHELSPRQVLALRALLSERNKTAAANRVGVSRVTLWRWLKQPAFRAAVIAGKQAQVEAIRDAIRQRKL